MAAIVGTILTVYSLRFLIYSPYTNPFPESVQPFLAAAIGFVFGTLLLVAGLLELHLLPP